MRRMPRRLDRTHDAEQQPRDSAERDRDEQRRRVHPGRVETREARRPERDQRLQAEPTNGEAAETAGAGEDEAFRQ